MPLQSNSQTGPILTYIGPQGPPGTPPPMGNVSYRPYGPPGFTMPLGGCKQPYGMLTSLMASLYNTTSTFSKLVMNITSPLQGSGSTINNMGELAKL